MAAVVAMTTGNFRPGTPDGVLKRHPGRLPARQRRVGVPQVQGESITFSNPSNTQGASLSTMPHLADARAPNTEKLTMKWVTAAIQPRSAIADHGQAQDDGALP